MKSLSPVQLFSTPWTAAYQAPWDFPGKSTGVGCHCLLLKKSLCYAKSLQWCPTPSDPMDYSLPGSSVHGIFQARALERGAILQFIKCSADNAYSIRDRNSISSGSDGQDLMVTAVLDRRRQWHPTPVLLPGKSHGRRSLVGCSPWGR